MKKYLIITVAVLLSFLVGMPVMAQYGPGSRDNYGRGMGRGMMGYDRGPGMMRRGYGMGPGYGWGGRYSVPGGPPSPWTKIKSSKRLKIT